MSSKLTRAAYEQLVAEDISWLEQQPRTLERDHVIQIVKRSVEHEYATPALPREVAMRVAREYGSEVRESLGEEGPSWAMTDTLDTRLAAIVSRHLPTDEEREAADAVVEAAMTAHEWQHDSVLPDSVHEACSRLLAIRAKRGAR